MKITDIDKAAKTVTVERPQGNTKAAAHKAGDTVLIEPPIIDPSKASITQPACGQTAPVAQPTSSGPAGTPTAEPTPAANAQTLAVTAENVAFDPTTLTANASAPITISFDNKDAGIDHNIHFFQGASASGTSVGDTPNPDRPDHRDTEPWPAGGRVVLLPVRCAPDEHDRHADRAVSARLTRVNRQT